MIVRRDAPRSYGLTRYARIVRVLLGGLVKLVSAVTWMLCAIVLAFAITGLTGSSSESDSANDLGSGRLWHAWLLLLAISITGSIAGRHLMASRRSLVLWLRRFRHGEATRAVTSALGHLGRSWRVVTLDDKATVPIGASPGLRDADELLTRAGRLLRLVGKRAPRISKVVMWVSILGIGAVVLWTLIVGGLDGLDRLSDEVFSSSPTKSLAAWLVILFWLVLVVELVLWAAYLVVLLLMIPFVGVRVLVDRIRGGVRSAENEKRRTVASVAQADATAIEISMLGQGAWAPRLTVLTVDTAVWQQTVERFAQTAAAIVIDVSKPSESLNWEVEHVQRGPVRAVFVGHRDLVTAISGRAETVGGAGANDADRMHQLLEDEPILAYTTGWLGRQRFHRALYGELESSRASVPWTGRRAARSLVTATCLMFWGISINALVQVLTDL